MKLKLTKAQKRALEFFDYNERDPIRLMGVKKPSGKTRNWLIRHLLLNCRPVGAFDMKIFELSDTGREELRRLKPW